MLWGPEQSAVYAQPTGWYYANILLYRINSGFIHLQLYRKPTGDHEHVIQAHVFLVSAAEKCLETDGLRKREKKR